MFGTCMKDDGSETSSSWVFVSGSRSGKNWRTWPSEPNNCRQGSHGKWCEASPLQKEGKPAQISWTKPAIRCRTWPVSNERIVYIYIYTYYIYIIGQGWRKTLDLGRANSWTKWAAQTKACLYGNPISNSRRQSPCKPGQIMRQFTCWLASLPL